MSDQGNNRILEFTSPINSGELAAVVIGQPTFTSGAPGTSQRSLNQSKGIAFDSSGNLWVADGDNNRVLEFLKGSGFTNGEPASVVIGQQTFTSSALGTTASGLNYPKGIAFDSSGNLWVTDENNGRVLEFTKGSGFSSGMSASLVIGKPTFTSSTPTTTQSGMSGASGLTFDSSGNLWVNDYYNNRMLEFASPFTNGESALLVIGQPTFTSGSPASGQSGLHTPDFLGTDSSGNMWVTDEFNNRVLEFACGSGCSPSTVASSTSVSTNTSPTQTPTTSNAGGGGIPEFPYQLVATTVFTIVLVASYLIVRRNKPLIRRNTLSG